MRLIPFLISQFSIMFAFIITLYSDIIIESIKIPELKFYKIERKFLFQFDLML